MLALAAWCVAIIAGTPAVGTGPVAATLGAQTVEQNDSSARAARRANSLPLIPTRTLDFTTDEGSWISLDLSPDGGTILFELLGDLYTLPVAGGTATRITSGQGYDMQPRYSPNGSEIVFVSDRDGSENLWVARADGTGARQLTDTERQSYMSPVWSPDGDYVLANRGSQLWFFHRDGGGGLQMTGQREEGAPAPPSMIGAAFGADPRYLWVNVSGNLGGGFPVGAGGGSAEALEPDLIFGPMHPSGPGEPRRSSAREVGRYQIGMLDRENGQVLVRTHEHEGAFRPMPSPDGRWLVYATRYDSREALRLLDLETGEESWLVMDVQRDDSQGGGTRDRDVYPGSAWTPDSRALITSYGGKVMRVEVPSGEATEIPFTAHIQQELGPLAKFDYPINDSVLTVSQIRGARPSPDGSQLVFTALDRLWIAPLPESAGTQDEGYPVIEDARRLTTATDIEHGPVWSPDGRHIAYVTWNDSVGGDIWRVGADGSGEPERLTPESAFYDRVAYNGDGSRILAVRGSKMHRMRTLEDFGQHGSAAELQYVWLPADGGEPSRIMWVGRGATQQGRNAPHPGPDPDRIYVWTGSDGLVSVRYDGTDPRTVVRVTAPSAGGGGGGGAPDEVVLSPDGKRAMVRASRNVFMITVPPSAGAAPTIAVTSSAVPTRRLTEVGGDFVGWTRDGSAAVYSIGRSFFRYDVAVADSLIADSLATARAEAEEEDVPEEEEAGGEPGDTADVIVPDLGEEGEAGGGEEADEDEGGPVYEAARFDVEITVPKDRPRGTLVLSGARLITMRGDEIIPRGDIVVRDNRIAAVGPTGSVQVPEGAEVRDMSGKTILPGLVDIHAHTWVAWGVHRTQVSQFLAQLAYGVTTQRDPQTSSEDVVTYSDLMETGELIGPRIYSTGPGVFSADRSAASTTPATCSGAIPITTTP